MNRRILKRTKKKTIKNLGLVRGRSFGGGGIKKVNGSWTEGVKPKLATKVALRATTSLTSPMAPKVKKESSIKLKRTPAAFKKTVNTVKKAQGMTRTKGLQRLVKKSQTIPKNVRPAKTIKRSTPKR